jgi:glycosyltransferase involved in cell wall biosynthesis
LVVAREGKKSTLVVGFWYCEKLDTVGSVFVDESFQQSETQWRHSMNILQISPIERRVPPRKYGGIERIVKTLADGLASRGHTVSVMASGDSLIPERLLSLRHLPLLDDPACSSDLKYRESQFAVVVARILEHLRGHHYDVVHNHLGWRLLPYWRLISDVFVTTLQTPLESPAKDIVFEASVGASIISVSDRQRRGRPNLNYAATVYNGIDLSTYALGKGEGGYLLFLGRMASEKGPVEAIQIARRLKKRLVMAAAVHAWEEEYFQTMVCPLIDGRDIVFVGEVDDSQKNGLLGNAEALLNPIQWEEPFGLACIEALACGTPVLTLNRGAMAEIVKDRVTGLIAECSDELVERFSEVRRCDRLACRAEAECRFSLESMTDSYVSVYRSLMRRN